MKTNKQVLKILAALVWYIGGVMLLRGGVELIWQAHELKSGTFWPWIFIPGGLILGFIQARTIFSRSCRNNLQRISDLDDPRLWQFFRPGFFLALAVMISSGILLDHWSQGNYFLMLGVAALDIALTLSLWGSSTVFWTYKPSLPDQKHQDKLISEV